MNGALRQGWLAEDANGDYYVTNKVRDIFRDDFRFPKSLAKAKANGARSASRGPREKPEAFSAIDEFPTRMDGFPPYPTLRSEGARLLWVLVFAKNHGIKGLRNRDVAWLTDHLGVGVPSGNVGGAVRGRKAAGHLNQSTADQTLRITDAGEEFLKAYGGGDS